MKELWLLRHAKSDRKVDVIDIYRPLKKRGKRDAKNMGIFLKNQQLIPDALLSSPATRAIETIKIIYQELQIDNLVIQEDARLYATGIEQLKMVLAGCPETIRRVLVVGHNPELEDLLLHLVGEKALPDVEKLLPTTALVRLSLDCSWEQLHENCAQLLSITHAKSLLES
ncbi:MAG: histidine phosphatase family protein [Methylococcaceae bacterium]|nr:histidine phosphatase family protein [Methylococcaceae bacterium]